MVSHFGTQSASHLRPEALKVEYQPQPRSSETFIVPFAIPGCGKTAVSVGPPPPLTSSNLGTFKVITPTNRLAFVRNVIALMESYDVVVANKYVLSYCVYTICLPIRSEPGNPNLESLNADKFGNQQLEINKFGPKFCQPHGHLNINSLTVDYSGLLES